MINKFFYTTTYMDMCQTVNKSEGRNTNIMCHFRPKHGSRIFRPLFLKNIVNYQICLLELPVARRDDAHWISSYFIIWTILISILNFFFRKGVDNQIPPFDKNLEEFYSICDQIELHLVRICHIYEIWNYIIQKYF